MIWLSKANWNRLGTNSAPLATTKTFHYKTINKLITLSIPGLSCQSIFNLSSVVFWLQEHWDRACLVFLFNELNNFDGFCLDMSKTTKLHHPSEEEKTENINCLVRDKSRRGRWAVTQRSIIMSKELSFRTN